MQPNGSNGHTDPSTKGRGMSIMLYPDQTQAGQSTTTGPEPVMTQPSELASCQRSSSGINQLMNSSSSTTDYDDSSMLYRTFEIRIDRGDINRFLQTDVDLAAEGQKFNALPGNSRRARTMQVVNILISLYTTLFVVWRWSFRDVIPSRAKSIWDAVHVAIGVVYLVVIIFLRFCVSCLDEKNSMELFAMRTVIRYQIRHLPFWMHILSTVGLPFQIVSVAMKGELNLQLLWIEILRAHQLLTIPHFLRYWNVFQIIRLIVITFFCAHVIACFWWFSVHINGTWEQHLELSLFQDVRILDEYSYALHLGVLALLGRGPRVLSNQEMLMAAILGLGGTLLMAVIFGEMNLVVQRIYTLETRHVAKVASVKQALGNMHVPYGLRIRILKFHEYIDTMHNDSAAQNLFERLSGPLALELKLNIYHSLVTRAPFFQNAHLDVIKNIVVSLQDAVYLPGDYVIRKGDCGREMFFIFRGSVEVLNTDRVPLAILTTGLYFGEVALLTDRKRGAWVQAATYCILAVLSKDDLDIILEDFPEALTALFRRMQQVCNISASISLDELRARLLQRFRTLDDAFAHMDTDQRWELNILDFQRALRRLNIDKTDAKLLFALIDREGRTVLTANAFRTALGGDESREDEGDPTTTGWNPKGSSRRTSAAKPPNAQGNLWKPSAASGVAPPGSRQPSLVQAQGMQGLNLPMSPQSSVSAAPVTSNLSTGPSLVASTGSTDESNRNTVEADLTQSVMSKQLSNVIREEAEDELFSEGDSEAHTPKIPGALPREGSTRIEGSTKNDEALDMKQVFSTNVESAAASSSVLPQEENGFANIGSSSMGLEGQPLRSTDSSEVQQADRNSMGEPTASRGLRRSGSFGEYMTSSSSLQEGGDSRSTGKRRSISAERGRDLMRKTDSRRNSRERLGGTAIRRPSQQAPLLPQGGISSPTGTSVPIRRTSQMNNSLWKTHSGNVGRGRMGSIIGIASASSLRPCKMGSIEDNGNDSDSSGSGGSGAGPRRGSTRSEEGSRRNSGNRRSGDSSNMGPRAPLNAPTTESTTANSTPNFQVSTYGTQSGREGEPTSQGQPNDGPMELMGCGGGRRQDESPSSSSSSQRSRGGFGGTLDSEVTEPEVLALEAIQESLVSLKDKVTDGFDQIEQTCDARFDKIEEFLEQEAVSLKDGILSEFENCCYRMLQDVLTGAIVPPSDQVPPALPPGEPPPLAEQGDILQVLCEEELREVEATINADAVDTAIKADAVSTLEPSGAVAGEEPDLAKQPTNE